MTLAALAIIGSEAGASEAADRVASCDSETLPIFTSGLTPSERVTALEPLRDACEGTGIYEVRLGHAYSVVGRAEEGERLVRDALATTTGFELELRWVLANIQFVQSRFEEAETEARRLVADFPNSPNGYTILAKVLLATDDYAGAVSALEKSVSLEEHAETYLLLTIAHYNLQNYLESAQAMQTSLRMDVNGLLHTTAVASAALSLHELGHDMPGYELLEKHAELVPDAVSTPAFQYALQRYQQAAE